MKGMVACEICGTEFKRLTVRHKRCSRECSKEAIRRKTRQWTIENPGAKRRHHLRTSYGITPEEYEDRLANQSGVCAICRQANGRRRLAVDHDHETGVVRGLLCDKCNWLVGLADDDPQRLTTAIAYLLADRRTVWI